MMQEVQARADRNLPDAVVDGDKLVIPPDSGAHGLVLDVPYPVKKRGEDDKLIEFTEPMRLKVTPWATAQLGRKMGVAWNKFFNPQHIKVEETQEMVQRWLKRNGMAFRIRASKFKTAQDEFDGYIRGFLNPGTSTIDDVKIFDALGQNFNDMMADFHFMQDHMGGDIANDHSSHYSVAGEPFEMGPLDIKNAPADLRRIYEMAAREGQLPDADYGFQGFHMHNSEVGGSAWSIGSFMYRLLCLNGYIVRSKKGSGGRGGGQLLYRTHVNIDSAGIYKLLRDALLRMEQSWEDQRALLTKLHTVTLQDPKEEIRQYVKRVKLSADFADKAVSAYDDEPIPTRIGVLHALSRAAQTFTDMDDRFRIETAAGDYMHHA